MNNSTQEKNENPVVTLKAQAEKFDFSKLRAGKENVEANSGKQAYQDIDRMDFTINDQSVDKILIKALINRDKKEFDKIWAEHYKNEKIPDHKKNDQYKKKFEEFYSLGTNYAHLLPEKENGNYRPFAKEIFKEMFRYAEAQVPSDSILEELVTNCNHQNNVSIRSDMKLPIFFHESNGQFGDKLCDLSSSLEFTLESQDGKGSVVYKDGKFSLTVPLKLRDYKTDSRNLFDIIKEYFYKFCEKLGFKLKIEHDLGDSIEVNSHLESVQPPIHSNEHENTL
ncbi:hypothetical protein wNo_01510 [Wolbachia endosymbiont of Drosophila simulans wNo]|uniref:hypothetical protein n=1 Tax=Wolbachia endosymbiont of Drosophila simulans TaxID=77038 RepID=UPI0002D24A2B|nr:hypothetical protein [Wolbachia endosymbiont of Drosophila simulans]AGJ98590.1 hypothetical protein wNo_01510 [Wolbachia endosymbiont of Drosophila simulans wNo]